MEPIRFTYLIYMYFKMAIVNIWNNNWNNIFNWTDKYEFFGIFFKYLNDN